MRILVALGGNALLRRGEEMTAENQRRNVRIAAEALAPLGREHQLVSSRGNGPQVGLLAMGDDGLMLPAQRRQGLGRDADVPPLILGGHLLAAPQQGVTAQGYQDSHKSPRDNPRVPGKTRSVLLPEGQPGQRAEPGPFESCREVPYTRLQEQIDMAARNQHVVRRGDKWAVQSEGSKRASSVFETKQEAIDSAREIARRSGAQILIHGRTGQIFLSTDSPGRLSEETVRRVVRDCADKPLV